MEVIAAPLDGLVARARAEYREMPGLSLTLDQASRLLGVEPSLCHAVLSALVQDGVLRHTRAGMYIAASTTSKLGGGR